MRKRSVFLFTMIVLMFLIANLRITSIVASDNAQVAAAQSSIKLDIATARGTIYDCNLKPITNSNMRYVSAISPTPSAIAALGMIPNTQTAVDRLKNGRPVTAEIPYEVKADGINVFRIFNRYQDVQMAAHIVGYTDESNDGVSGIEKGFNEVLKRDSPLTIRYTCDARGKILTGIKPQIDNSNYTVTKGIALTIDSKIQEICERAASKYMLSGAVVVTDVATGKIKASVSVPTFSPNNLKASLNAPNSPFINRAITPYNAGSVFKLCVAAAAIESDITASYCCTGQVTIGSVTFNCHKKSGHGTMNLESALAVSCNTYFINLGQKLGAEKIYDMAKKLGFGYSNHLCDGITAGSGTLPDFAMLSEQKATLANFSFGQGDLLTTPLQIASMCQTIANGGKRISPTLIEGNVDENMKFTKEPSKPYTRVLKKETADLLCRYMTGVVEHGTGVAAKPEQFGAGGKTATAETGWVIGGRSMIQAWFAGFFPSNSPKYAVSILVENGKSGGVSAAPIFKEIADNINSSAQLQPND